jgi:hypothetical protein
VRAEVAIKQGAALILQLQFNNDDGTPADLGAVALSSQVRDGLGNLIDSLPIALGATTGTASITVADTSAWPVGVLRCDIKAVMGGLPAYSQTFAVRVERAVTA